MRPAEANDRALLVHMIEAAEKILEYTRDGADAFMANPMVQDAVIRNFEIMGEAAKGVSQGTRAAYPDVPWRRVGGFRDVLIHGYMGVDPSEVWGIVADHLTPLAARLREILKERGWG